MNRYVRAALSPTKSLFETASILSPNFFWNRVNRLARSQGFDRLYFCLSFDCDTEKDADVVESVDSKLREMGLLPSYAVPAELLKQQVSTYSKLRDKGAVFLNHGYQIHTVINEQTGHYESCLSYDALTKKEVEEDVFQGHLILKDFLGETPKGFRSPHFGTFQRASELRFLHSYLKTLGYEYSSSTAPVYSSLYGPVFRKFGLWEVPVTGTASRPREIYDSWSFFCAPSRRWKDGDYYKEAERLVSVKKKYQLVGLLNCYADPSQVWNRAEFFDAMALLSKHAESINLDQSFSLLDR